jgi:hypothetical protein
MKISYTIEVDMGSTRSGSDIIDSFERSGKMLDQTNGMRVPNVVKAKIFSGIVKEILGYAAARESATITVTSKVDKS